MLNVAIGLRRLGRTVRLVTDFGLDPDGEILAEYTASNGLELWLRADAERTNPTSVSRTVIGEDGVSSQSLTFTWDIQDIPRIGRLQAGPPSPGTHLPRLRLGRLPRRAGREQSPELGEPPARLGDDRLRSERQRLPD